MTRHETSAETIIRLIADCKREALPQARTRIASLLAYRLTPAIVDAIDRGDYDRARELLAAYWAYTRNRHNASAARSAAPGELRQMVRGYRANRARRDGTPLSVLARGQAYVKWGSRLQGRAGNAVRTCARV